LRRAVDGVVAPRRLEVERGRRRLVGEGLPGVCGVAEDAHPQVPVAGDRQQLVEAAHGLEGVAATDEAGGGDAVAHLREEEVEFARKRSSASTSSRSCAAGSARPSLLTQRGWL